MSTIRKQIIKLQRIILKFRLCLLKFSQSLSNTSYINLSPFSIKVETILANSVQVSSFLILEKSQNSFLFQLFYQMGALPWMVVSMNVFLQPHSVSTTNNLFIRGISFHRFDSDSHVGDLSQVACLLRILKLSCLDSDNHVEL